MTRPLADVVWPREAEGKALEALAASRSGTSGVATETEPVQITFGEAESFVRNCGPALICLGGSGQSKALLAVLRCRREKALVVGPDHGTHRVEVSEVVAALRAPLEASVAPEVEKLSVGSERVRAALLAERLCAAPLFGGWLLRLPPGASFRAQAREAGLLRDLASFVLIYLVSFALYLASWGALGAGVLEGRLAWSGLVAWGLLLATLIPFRVASVWSRAKLTVKLGALLKRRLLAGALSLQPEEIRHQGAGQLLGRVIESEAVETLTLRGGFLAVVGILETALSAVVLAAGVAGGLHLALLALWLAFIGWLGWRYYESRRRWTDRRIEMTHDLVERLVGHRTRQVQEPRELWHEEEDKVLHQYHREALGFDRGKAVFLGLASRGWLLVGLLPLVPGFLAGSAEVVPLALAVGGLLGSYRGLAKCSEGFSHLAGALLSWRCVTDLFRAAARPRLAGAGVTLSDQESPAGPVLAALDLSYRYQGRGRPALDGCNLEIAVGDRLLIEGTSGSGKSTLAALLAGLREPDAGLILFHGLDRHSLGEDPWRRRVVLAPQFHENHVLTETFAFNLLMGKRWPPEDGDLAEAEQVCRELGLGELLQRMPSGLQQIVGENGWQLSHGERSRL